LQFHFAWPEKSLALDLVSGQNSSSY